MNRSVLTSIVVASAFVVFFILVMPQYDSIKILRETVSDREALFAERSAMASKIKDLQQQVETRQSDINRLDSLVPRVKHLDEIISSIEKIATNSGVQLAAVTTSGAGGVGEQKRLFVNMDLRGTYVNMISLLKLIEQSLRLYDVSEITVSQDTGSGQGNNLNFTLKVHVYYLD